jgi:hypothetical protein
LSEKNRKKRRSNRLILGDCWCLTPFSAIFQLNHGDQSWLAKYIFMIKEIKTATIFYLSNVDYFAHSFS